MPDVALFDFDGFALYRALDDARGARGLSWSALAAQMWELSSVLNTRRSDHPISTSSVRFLAKSGATSCQHALFMLRWLGRSPESFLTGAPVAGDPGLPSAGPDRRLRWNLPRLAEALDERRHERAVTWAALARRFGCTTSQLTGIRTARFATGTNLAMLAVQWLERPSADFIDAARW